MFVNKSVNTIEKLYNIILNQMRVGVFAHENGELVFVPITMHFIFKSFFSFIIAVPAPVRCKIQCPQIPSVYFFNIIK